METPRTLQSAIAHFSDPQRAFESAVELRWPGRNITCPRCNQAKHSFVKTRKIWFCYVCKKQFTVKVGTIFEDSPLGLDKWMVALWMLANCKNGISSYELGKTLGIRQNSAWFMLHRIREAMKTNSMFKFGGEDGGAVESDETSARIPTRCTIAARRSCIRLRPMANATLARRRFSESLTGTQ